MVMERHTYNINLYEKSQDGNTSAIHFIYTRHTALPGDKIMLALLLTSKCAPNFLWQVQKV